MSAPVPVDALGPMRVLGDGAYGVVHGLGTYRLPGLPRLAFKQFKRPQPPERIANLEALVAARAAMSQHDRTVLDASTTWPVQLVTDGLGAVCGFLMPLLEPAFLTPVRLPSGTVETQPRNAQWLVVADNKVHAAGVPAGSDLPVRLLLCARVAHTLGVLHRHGLVFGDLSYNNAVFTADAGRPRTVLVDCDGVRSPAAPTLEQEHSPDWTPPENLNGTLPPGQQDQATDRYKLALLILRVLTPGALASVATDPQRAAAVLDPDGLRMLRSGLSGDRDSRPTAKQWFVHLVDLAAALTSPPVLTDVTVDAPFVLAGEQVQLSWRSRGARQIEVRTADGRVYRFPSSESTKTLPVRQPGAFTVTAVNGYGQTTGHSPHVSIAMPPRIDQIRLPEPALPTGRDAGAELGQRVEAMLHAARFDAPLQLPELPLHLPATPLSDASDRDLLAGTTVADWLRTSAPSTASLLAGFSPPSWPDPVAPAGRHPSAGPGGTSIPTPSTGTPARKAVTP